MTDERLAEILKQCHKYDTEEEETIIDLITALRAEKAKVAELVKLSNNEFKMYSALKLISNIEIDSENDKIKNPKLYNAVIIARQNLLRR